MNYIETACQIKKNGAVHIPMFLSGTALDSVEKEFDNIFSHIPDYKEAVLANPNTLNIEQNSNYDGGKHLRVMPPAYSNFPSLLSVFNTADFRDLVCEYLGVPNQFCMQIFMSNEYKVLDEKKWPRNSYLHFDPYSSLKFFLFLTDTDVEGGATHYVPQSHKVGRSYRMKKLNLGDTTGLHGGCKHRLEDYTDTPEYTQKDAVPVVAKRGDLLVIDTDTLHYGGVLQKEANRKVILVHNRPL